MIDQQPALPDSPLTMPTAPQTPMKPKITFSDDECELSTYKKWFERHTGLSLDEAITPGLAMRDHSARWKAARSPDGLWHLSHVIAP